MRSEQEIKERIESIEEIEPYLSKKPYSMYLRGILEALRWALEIETIK